MRKLVAEDGLTGVTSNPAIFEKAIGSGDAYDAGLSEFLTKADASIVETFESLAIADIQAACDDLRPVYDRLDGKDGYVSLEVSPYLALETDATLARSEEAVGGGRSAQPDGQDSGHRSRGSPAIRDAIAAGINVNVTLLFSLDAYRPWRTPISKGWRRASPRASRSIRIASVASFFVSRIDSVIDKKIDERVAAGE